MLRLVIGAEKDIVTVHQVLCFLQGPSWATLSCIVSFKVGR